MRVKNYLAPSLFLFLAACNSSEEIEKFPNIVNRYDSSRPKEVTGFKPLTGHIDENFIVEGNLGTDLSRMKVYFGERQAVLLSTDGQTIHGIVPKQPGGDNRISVVLDDDSIVTDIKFHYRQVQTITAVAGDYAAKQNWDGGSKIDASLAESSFSFICGLTVVAGGNLLVGETWFARLRLVSFEDNQVVTLVNDWSTQYCDGATNSTRDIAYLIERNNSHKLHQFNRKDGWVSIELRNSIPELTGDVSSCTMADDDRYLYVRDSHGNFGRLDLHTEGVPFEMLLERTFGGADGWTKICYSKHSDCFYATQPERHGIYKIWQDKTTQKWHIEEYAGFNGAGLNEGDRLSEAQFSYPVGICADRDGNVYVTNRSNRTIFKIWKKNGKVEHVAGTPSAWNTDDGGTKAPLNGKPLESTFYDPITIVIDEEENFFVAGENEYQIRKYSIE